MSFEWWDNLGEATGWFGGDTSDDPYTQYTGGFNSPVGYGGSGGVYEYEDDPSILEDYAIDDFSLASSDESGGTSFLDSIEDFAEENPVITKAGLSTVAGIAEYLMKQEQTEDVLQARKDLLRLEAELGKATTATAGSPGVLRREGSKAKRIEE